MASIPLHDITFDGLDNVYTIPQSASELVNDSSNVTGSTVADALDNLNTKIGTDLGALGSDDISNDSNSVSGTSVTNAIDNLHDAIDGLDTAVSGLTASQISNNSTVTGTKVSDALDTLSNTVDGLAGSDIANDATNVSGTSVSDALDTLDAAIDALGSDDIANESDVTGTNVSDALETLDSKIDALGSDDIANNSEHVAGDNVTEALEDHDERVSMFEGAVKSVSGGIASFNASVADIPLRNVTIDINPIQSGSGDPSPSNVRPISGWTGVTIKRTGKNFVDVSNVTNNSYNIGSIPNILRPNTTYTYSINGSTNNSYRLYLAQSSTPLSGSIALNLDYIGTGHFQTFTTPSDMSSYPFLCLAGREGAGNESIQNILPQIEFGSVATSYEQFISDTSYSITFPAAAGTVYGGTLDVTNGTLVVDRKLLTLSGTATLYSTDGAIFGNVLENTYNYNTNGIANMATLGGSANQLVLGINNKNIYWLNALTVTGSNDIAALNALLNETPLQICYKLSTPSVYQLTPTEICTILGENNIWSECGDTMAVYGNYLNAAMEVADKNLANEVYDYKNGTTVTGDIVAFESEVADLPLEECVVHIEPKQDFNGYSKPWIGGSGKNLLPSLLSSLKQANTGGTWNGNIYTQNGVTFAVESNPGGAVTSITINGTASANVSFNLMSGSLTLPTGTYKTILRNDTGDWNTLNLYYHNNTTGAWPSTADAATVTLDSDNVIEGVAVRTYTNKVLNNVRIYPMIYKIEGNVDDTFEPYSNICPIEGFDKATVKRTGKNLFDVENVSINTALGSVPGVPTSRASTPVSLPKGDYVISGISYTNSNWLRMTIYNSSSKTVKDTTTLLSNNTWQVNKTFTINDNDTLYLYATSTSVTQTFNDILTNCRIQVELGTTATDYEPYQESTFDVTFPTAEGTVYGGTLDVLTGELVVDKRLISLKISDLNATYEDYPGWNNVPNFSEIVQGTYNDFVFNNILSNIGGIISGYASTSSILIQKQFFGLTQTEWKTKYPDLVVEILFPLNSPYIYHLTPQEIKTLLGTNNLWCDAGNLTVTYGNYFKAGLNNTDNAVKDLKQSTALSSTSIATFNSDVADVPLKNCKVHIEPKQDLHGFSHAYFAGGGKNLIDINAFQLEDISSNVVTIDADGWLTINGTVEANSGAGYIRFRRDVPPNTYSLSANNQMASTAVQLSIRANNPSTILSGESGWFACASPNSGRTFTTTNTGYWIQIQVNNNTYSNFKLRPQLELGSIVTDYEPYENICPIEGFDSAEVYNYGKNIFNYRRANLDRHTSHNASTVGVEIGANRTLRVYGLYSYEWNNAQIDVYFPEPGIYTISADVIANTNGAAIGINNDSAANRVSNEHMRLSPGSLGKVYSTYNIPTAGYWFISLWCCNGSTSVQGNSTFANIQVEKGSEATTYEPYNQVDISFSIAADTVYSGTLDATNGVLTVDKAAQVINSFGGSAEAQGFRTNITLRGYNGGDYSKDVKCNMFDTATSYVEAAGSRHSSIGANGAGLLIVNAYVNGAYVTSLAELNNLIPEEGCQIVYPIAPITYYLTPQEVKCVLGQNNIWSNAGDVEVEYGAYLETLSGSITELNNAIDELNGTVVHNFLDNKAISAVIEEVTYTVNDDKTITVNGTSTGWSGLLLGTVILPKGNYVLKSGITAYPDNYNCYLEIKSNGQTITNTASVYRRSFSIQTDTEITVRLHARPNTALTNVVAYPEIKCSEDATNYTPYYAFSNRNLHDTINSEAITRSVLGAKNFIKQNVLSAQSYSGVTTTLNDDGTLSISGTATSSGLFGMIKAPYITLPNGKYIASTGRNSITRCLGYNGSSWVELAVGPGEQIFTASDTYSYYQFQMRLSNGATYSGKLYPMIRLATDIDNTFQKYAPTNSELNDAIYSISNVTFTAASGVTSYLTLNKVGNILVCSGYLNVTTAVANPDGNVGTASQAPRIKQQFVCVNTSNHSAYVAYFNTNGTITAPEGLPTGYYRLVGTIVL